MVKNSFTLIEILISITFLLIVISGLKYSTYYDEKENKNFMLLNSLENSFDTKNYTNLIKTQENIKIIKNKTDIENITLTKYEFKNDDIKIFKYEK